MKADLNSGPSSERNARSPVSLASMRVRQNAKLVELKRVLIESGYQSVDEQARALGLCRSSTWAVLNAGHKSSGLSSDLIKRITSSPNLPSKARTVIEEYVREKLAGAYGHSHHNLKRFRAKLGAELPIENAS